MLRRTNTVRVYFGRPTGQGGAASTNAGEPPGFAAASSSRRSPCQTAGAKPAKPSETGNGECLRPIPIKSYRARGRQGRQNDRAESGDLIHSRIEIAAFSDQNPGGHPRRPRFRALSPPARRANWSQWRSWAESLSKRSAFAVMLARGLRAPYSAAICRRPSSCIDERSGSAMRMNRVSRAAVKRRRSWACA